MSPSVPSLTFPADVHEGLISGWDTVHGPALWRVEAILGRIVDVGGWINGKGLMIIMVVGGDSGEIRDASEFAILSTHRKKTSYWADVCVPTDMLEGAANIDLAWMGITIRALNEVSAKLKLPPLRFVDWTEQSSE